MPMMQAFWSRLFAVTLLAHGGACGGRAGATSASTPVPVAAPVAAPRASPPAEAGPGLVAIDIYGTRQLTLERVRAATGDELRQVGERMMRDDPDVDPTAITDKLRALGDVAYVELALVRYYDGDGSSYYLTVDVVDREDAPRRLPFLPAGTGTHADPDGLLAAWQAYESKVFELLSSGELSPDRVACPALHCFGDPAHPALATLAADLATRVPSHVAELATILRDDRSSRSRGTVPFLLAYAKDGPAVVALLLSAFRDESSFVRNNAMRVVADIARYHPEIEIPLEPVLEALDYAATADRNKAAAILDGLLARPGAARLHRAVTQGAGATLLAMLRLEQPNNHGFAYKILKTISGRMFGERDYAAWEGWLAEALRP